MPIYEYQCTACGHQLEALQKVDEDPLTVCSECQQPKLQRLVSAAGLQFKGSGWYLTDYSNKGKAKTDTTPTDSGATAVGNKEAVTSKTDSSGASNATETTKSKTDSSS